MTAPPANPEPSGDTLSHEAFERRTRELGLDLSPEDVAELHCGWVGLQPFLARIRTGLKPLQRLGGAKPTAMNRD